MIPEELEVCILSDVAGFDVVTVNVITVGSPGSRR